MENSIEKKDVKIYVRGNCNYRIENREGNFVAILSYKGREKIINGTEYFTTDNKMIIKGIMESIKNLKEPCNVIVFVQCNIGFRCSGRNKDLIKIMYDEIKKGKHTVEFVIGKERQLELGRLIKTKKVTNAYGDSISFK